MRRDVLDLLDDLAAEERVAITTAEVRRRLEMSEQSASNLMTRLVEAGFLDRVARGIFAPRPLGQLGTRAASEDIALAVAAAFATEPHLRADSTLVWRSDVSDRSAKR
jgi:predicted transcriptional regulator of viral defense system